jgi:hypothetical protein
MDQTLAMHVKRRWQSFPVGDPADLLSVLGQIHRLERIAFFGAMLKGFLVRPVIKRIECQLSCEDRIMWDKIMLVPGMHRKLDWHSLAGHDSTHRKGGERQLPAYRQANLHPGTRIDLKGIEDKGEILQQEEES